jgi:hypothetical protein
MSAALQAAEKVHLEPGLVAQPLLAVWILQRLTKAHSQEWLCYTTFSAACEAYAGLVLSKAQKRTG